MEEEYDGVERRHLERRANPESRLSRQDYEDLKRDLVEELTIKFTKKLVGYVLLAIGAGGIGGFVHRLAETFLK